MTLVALLKIELKMLALLYRSSQVKGKGLSYDEADVDQRICAFLLCRDWNLHQSVCRMVSILIPLIFLATTVTPLCFCGMTCLAQV